MAGYGGVWRGMAGYGDPPEDYFLITVFLTGVF